MCNFHNNSWLKPSKWKPLGVIINISLAVNSKVVPFKKLHLEKSSVFTTEAKYNHSLAISLLQTAWVRLNWKGFTSVCYSLQLSELCVVFISTRRTSAKDRQWLEARFYSMLHCDDSDVSVTGLSLVLVEPWFSVGGKDTRTSCGHHHGC